MSLLTCRLQSPTGLDEARAHGPGTEDEVLAALKFPRRYLGRTEGPTQATPESATAVLEIQAREGNGAVPANRHLER
jgi:hypothetical protein